MTRQLDERTARHLVSSFKLDDPPTRELLRRHGLPVVTNGTSYGLSCGMGIVTWQGHEYGTLLSLTSWIRPDPDYPPHPSQLWHDA